MATPIDPTAIRLGIVGGGQLGQMMSLAAHRLGLKVTCLDPGGLASPAGKVRCGAANAVASEHVARNPHTTGPSARPQVCGSAVVGGLTDGEMIRKLASEVDVLTVEIEHIDTGALAAIEAEGRVAVHPSPKTLSTIQDKFVQKKHLSTVDGE